MKWNCGTSVRYCSTGNICDGAMPVSWLPIAPLLTTNHVKFSTAVIFTTMPFCNYPVKPVKNI